MLVLTSVILAFTLWGNYELRQEFDPMWFIPKESYLSRWNQMNEKWVLYWHSGMHGTQDFLYRRFFPSQGEKIHIFFTDTILPEELGKLDYIVSQLQQQVKLSR